MKKTLLILAIVASSLTLARAQVVPSFAMGIKGGENFSSLSTSTTTFNASNQNGYFGGLWTRFGALGINFQSEVLYDQRTMDISNTSLGINSTNNTITSIDVPLLLGAKIGTRSFGVRFYAGGVASFVIQNGKSVTYTIAESIKSFKPVDYQVENYYLTGGLGIDLGRLSVDARYERGLTDVIYNGTDKSKVNLFNVSVAFTMFRF